MIPDDMAQATQNVADLLFSLFPVGVNYLRSDWNSILLV
jgi:hypothetical protein